jgi:hypothetical protein
MELFEIAFVVLSRQSRCTFRLSIDFERFPIVLAKNIVLLLPSGECNNSANAR